MSKETVRKQLFSESNLRVSRKPKNYWYPTVGKECKYFSNSVLVSTWPLLSTETARGRLSLENKGQNTSMVEKECKYFLELMPPSLSIHSTERMQVPLEPCAFPTAYSQERCVSVQYFRRL
jgi:hypothetical protein